MSRHLSEVDARLTFLGLLLMVLAIPALVVDIPCAYWAKEDLYPKALVKICNLSEFFAHGFGVAVVGLTVALLEKRCRWRVVSVLITAFSAGLSADLLKLVVYRFRPRDFDLSQGVLASFRDLLPVLDHSLHEMSSSFPSSHAATAAGLAFILIRLYPEGRPVFFLLFFLACLQRVVVSAHFPSDVLFGAGLGWIVAWSVVKFVLPSSWLQPELSNFSGPKQSSA